MLVNSNSTNKLSIPNSIILNNYSIQNLIITPNNFDNYYQIPGTSHEYYKQNYNQNSFSPSPKKSPLNFDSLYLNQIYLTENKPILTAKPSYGKLNTLRISSPPIISRNGNNQKIFPLTNIKIEKDNTIRERHPQDSVSKSKQKKNNKNRKNNNTDFNKINFTRNSIILKTSISQEHLFIPKKVLETKDDKVVPFPRNNLSKKKKLQNTKIIYLQPKDLVNLKEFLFGKEIGKGTFGKIFSVKWKKNNKYYAMKKEILNDLKEKKKRKINCKIMQNFIKRTGNHGVINLYGNLCFKNKNKINIATTNINNDIENIKVNEYIYYELMEKAERDWDKEINVRSEYSLYYTEEEIKNIMNQLISTLSLLQKFHITHRDIKPQNILVLNGKYKLCDFGEIRVLKRDGLIVQRVRGSELYMSPILFRGLHNNLIQVKHNTYKSDVFSLGMCLFFAASLTYGGVDSIRELDNMDEIKNILFDYLGTRYSEKLISLILLMLEVDENKRPNFVQLEEKLKNINKSE